MQSLGRLVAILRVLAAAGDSRLRLTEIARAAGLGKATTLRLLAALLDEGLVNEDGETKTFALGAELVFLGLSASRHFRISRIARPALERLALATGDTAYLTLRSGADSVCGDRVFGAYPVMTATVQVGARRPLGIGAGSLALLAALPEGEAEELLRQNAPRIAGFPGFSAERIRREAEETRARGYAYTRSHVVQDVHAIGVAVRDPLGNALGAVSVAAISSRFANGRDGEIAAAVLAAAREVERLLPARKEEPVRKEEPAPVKRRAGRRAAARVEGAGR